MLAAGAVVSPKLLELSGVGAAARLNALGITVVKDAPGVGENLQDHLQLRPVYKVEGARTLNGDYARLWRRAAMGLEYALLRKGPLTMAPSQVGAFARSSPAIRHAQSAIPFPAALARQMGRWAPSLRRLHGERRQSAPDEPRQRARDEPRSFAPPPSARIICRRDEDRRVAVEALRLTRRIVAQKPLERFQPSEHIPGAANVSDADLIRAAGDLGTTIFHPVGTANMGADHDRNAVLDERLRVRGVAGLRVIDASAMPRITSGNTNSPTLMIAEKGAMMMREDAGA